MSVSASSLPALLSGGFRSQTGYEPNQRLRQNRENFFQYLQGERMCYSCGKTL